LQAPKMTFETNEFYLKDNAEMASAFAEWPEALQSTIDIAERCDVSIELGKQLIPRYPTPDGADEGAYLRTLVDQGLRLRYGDPVPAHARERADMELGVIDRMGFNAYFLIVWDFVRFAKDNGIAVGPGRGSAAGSIVSYALRITDVDPLRYDLLFERFLNPERVSMPDIDIDFSVRGRERVIRYVTGKYGADQAPVPDIVALQLADAGADENGERVFRTVTQFSMKPIEEIGLLKMDFLGLRNLDVIEDAVEIIRRSTGDEVDMSTVDLDDAQ